MTLMMSKSSSTYANAPDMLLDKIEEVEALLAKTKAKSGENDSYKFWKSVLDVMKFAWAYMMDTKWIHRESALIKGENDFLKDYTRKLKNDLTVFETVRELRINGNLEEVIQNVDAYMNNPEIIELLKLKKEKNGRD